ncbi:MAG: DegT/DnrJ/EryC1/StrS family aminotransferase [Clostridia bacterium]|nr:DegT/DnrJ/EryC1/StrS family aminotransferase [Clostridia bacterium]
MLNIPFSPPDITEAEINEVCEALRSGWITTGPRTKEFERRIAAFCGTEKSACLNSATAALELNLRVLGIGEGDEVIVPAYTYTASASAAIHAGAKVVFVDCKPDSFEADYERLEAAINEKTKAIIPVDLAGIICDYDKIYAAVENKKHLFKPANTIQNAMGRVAVVADCAHALGATRNGKNAGEIADFSSFSFHAVKNLTTAEGGAATWRSIDGIDNEELYKQYMLFSLHGQSKDALAKTRAGAWEYDIVGPWYKCNMTDVTAAIGLKQLERYPSLMARRKEIIASYDEICDKLGVMHLEHYSKNHSGSGHLYITRIPGISEETRNGIITEMAERGIACNVHYKPLPMMTAYKKLGFDIADFPNAYEYFKNEITLPLHTKLTDAEVEYVTENFAEIIKKHI